MWICGGGSVVQPLIRGGPDRRVPPLPHPHHPGVRHPAVWGAGGPAEAAAGAGPVHRRYRRADLPPAVREEAVSCPGPRSLTSTTAPTPDFSPASLTASGTGRSRRTSPHFQRRPPPSTPSGAVETHRENARRVYRSLDQFGREGKRWRCGASSPAWRSGSCGCGGSTSWVLRRRAR